MNYQYSSNPEYEDRESPGARKAVAAAMFLDDIVLAAILAGGTAAVALGKGLGGAIGRSGRRGAIAAVMAGALTLGAVGNANAEKLSAHFSKEEFNQKNAPLSLSQYEVNPLLVQNLEELRKLTGNRNIKITSGYRSPEYNRRIGGAKKSQHVKGNAADIQVEGLTPGQVRKKAVESGLFSYVEPLSMTPTWTHVDVRGKGWGRKKVSTSTATRAEQLRKATDYVASLSETSPASRQHVSDLLFETAIHESGGLKYTHQFWGKSIGIFQIEPETAKNLVKWASTRPRAMDLLTTTSGLTAKELTSLTKQQLADRISKNETFAAAVARVKYFSSPGHIPSTMEARAVYWGKYYQGDNNPVKEQQYMRDSRLIAEEVKASALSNVVAKHVEVRPTQGLVNKVLHDNKVMHNVASNTKKSSRMWRILGRR